MRISAAWARQLKQVTATAVAQRPLPKPSQEDALALHIHAAGLPPPMRQHRFHSTRQWRFDFAWPDRLIACEVEGLVVRRVNGRLQTSGRHATITGLREDCRKYNAAAALGWRVIRVTQDMVRSGEALQAVEAILAGCRP